MTEIDRDLLLETFLAEAEEGFAVMEEVLVGLEESPDDAEACDALFRAVHTLKGNASIFGFTAVGRLAHRLEDLLDRLRQGDLQVSSALVSRLLQAVDVLREAVPAAAGGEEEESPRGLALLDELAHFAVADGPGPTGEANDAIAADAWGSGREADDREQPPRPDADRAAGMLRVRLDRLDQLLDLVGEIGVARGQLSERLEDPRLTRDHLLETHRAADNLFMSLQEVVMGLRMVAVGPTFRRHVRTVRDLASAHGKQARLVTEGEDVEVDASVIERLRDPLTHLLRNALDHGIETPESRQAAGKDPCGVVTLRARHEAGSIVIQVEDDGAGIDRRRVLERAVQIGRVAPDESGRLTDAELQGLIFEPGFSTAVSVTDLSGRGVGMDVVRNNVETLRGAVTVVSVPHEGTTVRIRLPLTLAIVEGFRVGVADEVYVIPVDALVEIVELPEEALDRVGGGILTLRGRAIPYVRLRELFRLPGRPPARQGVAVVRTDGGEAGLVVDRALGEGQAVIKPLSPLFRGLSGVAGSAVLGSGRVAFVLDVESLLSGEMKRRDAGRIDSDADRAVVRSGTLLQKGTQT